MLNLRKFHPLKRLDPKWETALLLMATLLVVTYIGFVLYSNYHSHLQLRQSSLRLMHQDVEKRARGLQYVSETLKKDILAFAHNGKINLFFENKALGMSMEYGLGSTLQAISASFDQQIIEKRNNSDKPVFYRILFTDDQGNMLVDTQTPYNAPAVPEHIKQLSKARPDGFYLIAGQNPKQWDAFYTTPYYFKGTYVGQISAWIISENAFGHFITTSKTPGRYSGIVCGSGPILNHTHVHPSTSDAKPSIFFEEHDYNDLLKSLQIDDKTTTINVPIEGTPFALFEILTMNHLFGKTSPQTLLVAMVALAAALLGVMLYVMLIVTQNRVLHTRVSESNIKEKEIAAKNEELQAEIEERKRAEMEGARLTKRLQHAEKMEAIGTLAGGVAHDLNNILSGVVGYPELLLLEIPEDSPYRSSILKIKQSGQKAGAIVQDLLNLARRAVLNMNVVNLDKIIEEYLKSAECDKLKQHHPNVKFVTNTANQELQISGSSLHLSKMIMNLVSNAAEAMSDGGTLSISTSKIHVDPAFAEKASISEGGHLLLRISDTGTGIAQKDIDNIFEPFYTKKTMGRSGTGLGMTVVWGVVKDHNGYIDVQSVEGKGTTFDIYFPTTEEPLEETKKDLTLREYIGHGQSVLVVDDMPEQCRLAKMMLKKLGYDATTVNSGEEAIDYLSINTVDVVVMDMLMDPGIDGLETYQQIKTINPKQKAVIASGFSETRRVKAAIKLGANEYLRKPYSLESIGIALHKTLKAA